MWEVQECEASIALVAVLGEKEKGAPALAVGAVRVGGAGTGAIYLDGSVGEKEKAAPAPAEGAVRWAVQECGASIALVAVSKG